MGYKSKKLSDIASKEKLENIRKMFLTVTEDRISAVIATKLKSKDLSVLVSLFDNANLGFAEESDRLHEVAKTYNDKYATEYNGDFSTAYKTLELIKKQVFFLYTILTQLSESKKQRPGYAHIDTSSFEYKASHSFLVSGPYMDPIFDDKTELQKRLIINIVTFKENLDNNIALCEQIIEEESRIAENPNKLMVRFEAQIDEVLSILDDDMKKPKDVDAPYYKALLHAYENPEVLKEYWHKLKPKQFRNVACGIQNAQLANYTALERETFNEDLDTLVRFRTVVDHIDEVGKLSGKNMYYAFKYTDQNISQASFLRCFANSYKSRGGMQKIVTPQQVSQAHSSMLSDNTPEYLDFQYHMNSYC